MNPDLGADEVVGVLGEGGVVDQPRPVHQVEQVAVVRTKVQQGQGLGHRVGLAKISSRPASRSEKINFDQNQKSIFFSI